jgi:hypothetical protein
MAIQAADGPRGVCRSLAANSLGGSVPRQGRVGGLQGASFGVFGQIIGALRR